MVHLECEECGHELPAGFYTICPPCERLNADMERRLQDRQTTEYWEEEED